MLDFGFRSILQGPQQGPVVVRSRKTVPLVSGSLPAVAPATDVSASTMSPHSDAMAVHEEHKMAGGSTAEPCARGSCHSKDPEATGRWAGKIFTCGRTAGPCAQGPSHPQQRDPTPFCDGSGPQAPEVRRRNPGRSPGAASVGPSRAPLDAASIG
eukprot:6396598-Pyramimonas_sp.AAC.2